MAVSLGWLASRFGCELRGDPDARVERVATLLGASAGAVSFLANSAYRKHLKQTDATVVVLSEGDLPDCPTNALVSSEPYATFARIAAHLYPAEPIAPGVHASAVVEPDAHVDPSAHIAALAYVGPGSEIGPRAYVGPHAVVGKNCRLLDDAYLHAQCTLVTEVTVGRRSIVHSGTVLGADGFGHARSSEGYVKVPQVGGVVIGDDVEIGANSAVDRGAIGDTVIEDGVRIDNFVQVAHNCRIGAHTVIAAYAGLSGSTTIGKRCMIAGKVGFVGHLDVCDDVVVFGGAVVTKSITEPGTYSGTFPAEKDRDWKRKVARIRRLDELATRVSALEKGGMEEDDQ